MSVFLMSVLMLSVMGTFVLADEDVSVSAGLSQAEVASATADDKVESSSGIFSDRLKLIFAANSAKKAEIRTKIAAKKMNQLKTEKDPEKAEKIAKEYKEELDNALKNFNEIAVDGEKEEVIRALKRTVIMKYRLESHQTKVSEVHSAILARQSEKLNKEQSAHLEEVFGDIDDKVSSKIYEIEELQENLIARAVALGLNEEEIRAKLKEFENSLKNEVEARKAELKEHRTLIKEELGKIEIRERIKTSDGEVRTEVKIESDGETRTEIKIESGEKVIALN